MAKKNNVSYDEFANMVLKSIEDEPYFDKEVLLPKIKVLAKSFNLMVSSNNYRDIDSPTEYQKKSRQLDMESFAKKFWQRKFRESNEEELFKQNCKELDESLIEAGF